MRQMRALAQTADATVMELVNVAEQACNVLLRTGAFPTTYAELQPIPVLTCGVLTYAGDDGMQAGQAYRASIDLTTATMTYRMRGPNAQGIWEWRTPDIVLALPQPLVQLLHSGKPQAPTLREVIDPGHPRYAVLDVIVEVPTIPAPAWDQQDRVLGWDWGVRNLLTTAVVTLANEQEGRPFFLDTGGFDGSQARLRRQIDRLKRCEAKMTALLEQRAEHEHRARWAAKRAGYAQEIALCWRKYERRNRDLAHLAANVLLFLAQIHGCALICGEHLSSLRTLDRGHSVQGRWRNWRTNTTIRADLQRVLAYKAHRWGIRVRQEPPKDTSHTCPRCQQPANTYRSSHPDDATQSVPWGKWLICRQPALWLEWSQGLCRRPQPRASGGDVPAPHPGDRTVSCFCHGLARGPPLPLYTAGGAATVTGAELDRSPSQGQETRLSRLDAVRPPAHLASFRYLAAALLSDDTQASARKCVKCG